MCTAQRYEYEYASVEDIDCESDPKYQAVSSGFKRVTARRDASFSEPPRNPFWRVTEAREEQFAMPPHKYAKTCVFRAKEGV